MYAVVKTGGKQYKVEQGLVLRFEKIPGEVGSPVRFDQVLIFADGGDVHHLFGARGERSDHVVRVGQ